MVCLRVCGDSVATESSNTSDGLLLVILNRRNGCIEGDRIEAVLYTRIGVGVWIVGILGVGVLTCGTVGLVRDLEDIGVSIVGLPESKANRNHSTGTLYVDGSTYTVETYEGEVDSQNKVSFVAGEGDNGLPCRVGNISTVDNSVLLGIGGLSRCGAQEDIVTCFVNSTVLLHVTAAYQVAGSLGISQFTEQEGIRYIGTLEVSNNTVVLVVSYCNIARYGEATTKTGNGLGAATASCEVVVAIVELNIFYCIAGNGLVDTQTYAGSQTLEGKGDGVTILCVAGLASCTGLMLSSYTVADEDLTEVGLVNGE